MYWFKARRNRKFKKNEDLRNYKSSIRVAKSSTT